MVNLNEIPLGTKLGCRYTFEHNTSKIGKFSHLSGTPNKHMVIDGGIGSVKPEWMPIGVNRDLDMITSDSAELRVSTVRKLKSDLTYYSDMTKEVTQDYINANNYKKFIDVDVNDDGIFVRAVPKDTIVCTEMITGKIEAISVVDGMTDNKVHFYMGAIDIESGKIFVPKYTVDGDASSIVLDSTLTLTDAVNAINSDDITSFKNQLAEKELWNQNQSLWTQLDNSMGNSFEMIGVVSMDLVNSETGVEYTDDELLYLNGAAVTRWFTAGLLVYNMGLSSDTAVQYFNFIYCGRTTDGRARLIADIPMTQDLSIKDIVKAGLHQEMSNKPSTMEHSEVSGTFRYALPTSTSYEGAPNIGDYDLYIANDDLIPTKFDDDPTGERRVDWHSGKHTMCFTLSSLPEHMVDSLSLYNYQASGTYKAMYVERSEYDDDYMSRDFDDSAAMRGGAWRPILYVEDEEPANFMAPILPEVGSLVDLKAGENCKIFDIHFESGMIYMGDYSKLKDAHRYHSENNEDTYYYTIPFVCVSDNPKVLVADRLHLRGALYEQYRELNNTSITVGNHDYTLLVHMSESDYDSWLGSVSEHGYDPDEVFHTNNRKTYVDVGTDTGNYETREQVGEGRKYLTANDTDNCGKRFVLIHQPKSVNCDIINVSCCSTSAGEEAGIKCEVSVFDNNYNPISWCVKTSTNLVLTDCNTDRVKTIPYSKFPELDPESNDNVVTLEFFTEDGQQLPQVNAESIKINLNTRELVTRSFKEHSLEFDHSETTPNGMNKVTRNIPEYKTRKPTKVTKDSKDYYYIPLDYKES